ncbi:hypothetical protein IscW_ISCW006722 [Ixodes scapularis]|uniref:Uncharacterized protein n=1 Tax=Ixodes scapularis TaxID=6945 RepID=B7PL90_IXOSC|nr:hypothetical protein IscW_ISCW006722 [Ixodes scapularis]|eukprot:XP_002434538.1 hypothetical protein IscW_ISCW006722 [Ixodes scapularis]
MFAYVRYKDKHRALVPITLIKQSKPTDVDDFDPEKVEIVFWKKKDGTLAGHYKANVLMLGAQKRSLLPGHHTIWLGAALLAVPFPAWMYQIAWLMKVQPRRIVPVLQAKTLEAWTAMIAVQKSCVDLGGGLFMMAAQFNHCVKKSATDSKMVRNTALAFWTHEELLVRSVMGNPSRRFLKECPEGTK